jgi:hypothetical protein
VERVVLNALPDPRGSAAGLSAPLVKSKSSSLGEADPPSVLVRKWINGPGPVFGSRAQAGDYRILPDVIEFCCKLSAAFVGTQPMIEIPFLPNDVIDAVMKTFPISDDFAHDSLRANESTACK